MDNKNQYYPQYNALVRPVKRKNNLNYSSQEDIPTIQELRSHNPLLNSNTLGPEGKSNLYQFTIKNHDGTSFVEDRIRPSGMGLTDREKAEIRISNNHMAPGGLGFKNFSQQANLVTTEVHQNKLDEYINDRKAALRASGEEKLTPSINIVTPTQQDVNRSAELDNYNKILDRQFGTKYSQDELNSIYNDATDSIKPKKRNGEIYTQKSRNKALLDTAIADQAHNYTLDEAFDNLYRKGGFFYSDETKMEARDRFSKRFKYSSQDSINDFVKGTNKLASVSPSIMGEYIRESELFSRDSNAWRTNNEQYKKLDSITSLFNSTAEKEHATAVEKYINNRKAALRASGEEKLTTSVNTVTPIAQNIDRSAELDNFNKILDRQFGKQKTVLSDGGTHAGSRSENGSLDGGKEYTAERRLENAKKVLDEHKIDYNNMSEEKILEVKRNLKKDYWNKRKAALGGHGKAALGVGVAVTAGALVLGLSNSRGQQSNAQLYGQQPLSY